jgi:hypothetical protein
LRIGIASCVSSQFPFRSVLKINSVYSMDLGV